jgi:hypothetical protein
MGTWWKGFKREPRDTYLFTVGGITLKRKHVLTEKEMRDKVSQLKARYDHVGCPVVVKAYKLVHSK